MKSFRKKCVLALVGAALLMPSFSAVEAVNIKFSSKKAIRLLDKYKSKEEPKDEEKEEEKEEEPKDEEKEKEDEEEENSKKKPKKGKAKKEEEEDDLDGGDGENKKADDEGGDDEDEDDTKGKAAPNKQPLMDATKAPAQPQVPVQPVANGDTVVVEGNVDDFITAKEDYTLEEILADDKIVYSTLTSFMSKDKTTGNISISVNSKQLQDAVGIGRVKYRKVTEQAITQILSRLAENIKPGVQPTEAPLSPGLALHSIAKILRSEIQSLSSAVGNKAQGEASNVKDVAAAGGLDITKISEQQLASIINSSIADKEGLVYELINIPKNRLLFQTLYDKYAPHLYAQMPDDSPQVLADWTWTKSELKKGLASAKYNADDIEKALAGVAQFKEFAFKVVQVGGRLLDAKKESDAQLEQQRSLLTPENQLKIKLARRKSGVMAIVAKKFVHTIFEASQLKTLILGDFPKCSEAFVTSITNADGDPDNIVKAAAKDMRDIFNNPPSERDVDTKDRIERLAEVMKRNTFDPFITYITEALGNESSAFRKSESYAGMNIRTKRKLFDQLYDKVHTLKKKFDAHPESYAQQTIAGFMLGRFLIDSPKIMSMLQDLDNSDALIKELKLDNKEDYAIATAPKLLVDRLHSILSYVRQKMAEQSSNTNAVNRILEMYFNENTSLQVLVDSLYQPYNLFMTEVKDLTPADVDANAWLNAGAKKYVKSLLSAKEVAGASNKTIIELMVANFILDINYCRLFGAVGKVKMGTGAANALKKDAIISKNTGKKVEDVIPKVANGSPVLAPFALFAHLNPAIYQLRDDVPASVVAGRELMAALSSVEVRGDNFGRLLADVMVSPTDEIKALWMNPLNITDTVETQAADSYVASTGATMSKFAEHIGGTKVWKIGTTVNDVNEGIFRTIGYFLRDSKYPTDPKFSLKGSDGLLGAKGDNTDATKLNPNLAASYAYRTDFEYISDLFECVGNQLENGWKQGIWETAQLSGKTYSVKDLKDQTKSINYDKVGGYLLEKVDDPNKSKAIKGGYKAPYSDTELIPSTTSSSSSSSSLQFSWDNSKSMEENNRRLAEFQEKIRQQQQQKMMGLNNYGYGYGAPLKTNGPGSFYNGYGNGFNTTYNNGGFNSFGDLYRNLNRGLF